MIRKLAVVGVIVTGVVMLTAGAAFAHVEIARDGEVSASGAVKATLTVPNEETDSGTIQVVLVFPASPKLTDATADTVTGWTPKVEKDAAGDVTQITWTGGPLSGADKVELPMTIGAVPSDLDTVEFKALQTYQNGDVVRWIEPTPASGDEPEHPAPILYVKGDPPHEDDAAATTTTTHKDSSSSDDGLSTGAIVAIVVGVIIILALIGFFISRSRRNARSSS